MKYSNVIYCERKNKVAVIAREVERICRWLAKNIHRHNHKKKFSFLIHMLSYKMYCMFYKCHRHWLFVLCQLNYANFNWSWCCYDLFCGKISWTFINSSAASQKTTYLLLLLHRMSQSIIDLTHMNFETFDASAIYGPSLASGKNDLFRFCLFALLSHELSMFVFVIVISLDFFFWSYDNLPSIAQQDDIIISKIFFHRSVFCLPWNKI